MQTNMSVRVRNAARFVTLTVATLTALSLLPLPAQGQDATQAPAGGIISLDDAPLTVVREHISIQPTRVFVDYKFRNDTGRDLTTTLAFVVPDYELESDQDSQGRDTFEDCMFEIDGRRAEFAADVRATLHGRDVTALLRQEHIDIASFGHFDRPRSDLHSMPDAKLAHLVKAGLYLRSSAMDAGPLPRWSVQKRYVHRYTFHPGVEVGVRLSYAPVPGSLSSLRHPVQNAPYVQKGAKLQNASLVRIDTDSAMELRRVCAPAALQSSVQRFMGVMPHTAGLLYVDFSLTGEHAWASPVQDFALRVEGPKPTANAAYVPSVCWNASVPNATATQWSARASNYVPQHNLRVGWVQFQASEF